jgi:hypothetical protein
MRGSIPHPTPPRSDLLHIRACDRLQSARGHGLNGRLSNSGRNSRASIRLDHVIQQVVVVSTAAKRRLSKMAPRCSMLPAGCPARRINLGYVDYRAIDPETWEDREDDGFLVVHNAGVGLHPAANLFGTEPPVATMVCPGTYQAAHLP